MIDFESFENYVKAGSETRSFIFPTSLISHLEVIKIRSLLKQYKTTEALKYVAPIELGNKFYVETKCDRCHELNKERLSKIKLIEYINDQDRQNTGKSWRDQDHVCPSCQFGEKSKQKESYKNLAATNSKTVLEHTFYYLEHYLNPDRKWDEDVEPRQRLNRIRYANVNWMAVSDHIRGMDYQNFLKTPYWKAIAAHTKYKAGYRCQLCNSANNLVTHHRDYSIHGFEHSHMQELTVLCDNCHNKFHDIKKQVQVSKSKRRMVKIALMTFICVFCLFLGGYVNHSCVINKPLTFDYTEKNTKASNNKVKKEKKKQKRFRTCLLFEALYYELLTRQINR